MENRICSNVEVQLHTDGEDWEIYVDSYFLCNVKKTDVSEEAREILNIEER